MPKPTVVGFDRVFVIAGAIAVSTCIVLIAGMLLAALAFTNGIIVTVPGVASFDGSRALVNSPAVTVDGSWIAAAAVALMFGLPMGIFAARCGGPVSTAPYPNSREQPE